MNIVRLDSFRCIAGVVALSAAVLLVGLSPPSAPGPHCDSVDGPIVGLAQRALEAGDLTPVLKWVREEDEAEVRGAFERARAIRGRGESVRELADLWFVETLVRIHRQGEGEPYTGLKPAGSMDPVFAAADAALDAGSVDELAAEIAGAVREGIEQRFRAALGKRARADESVALGREYVAAYVTYMHFVEALHGLAAEGLPHGHFRGEEDDGGTGTGHGR